MACAGIFLWKEYYFFLQEYRAMVAYKKMYQQLVGEYKMAMDTCGKKQKELCKRDSEIQEQDQGMEPELCSSDIRTSDLTLHPAPRNHGILGKKTTNSSKKQKSIESKVRPLKMPIDHPNYRLGSRFGSRKRKNGSWGFHYGIDMPSPRGTAVKAAASGKVIEAGYSKKGYGKTIVLSHPNIKYQTRYAHLDKILVRVGQEVKVGQKIGLVGATGFVISENGSNDASHLHFEVKKQGKHIDPLCVLA